MKKISVFYSWQSDLPSKTNKDLIEEDLKTASAEFRANGFEIDIDRDTRDVSGSPLIAEVISDKIRNSDLFVADLSIVGELQNGRSVPNPNVLIELGYAMSALGSDRLILLVNTHYGPIDRLPFDIKHRRVARYSLSPDEAKTKGASKVLAATFAAALSNWLRDVGARQTSVKTNVWERPTLQADAAARAAIHLRDEQPFIDLSVRPSRSLNIPQDEQIRQTIFGLACDGFPVSLVQVGASGGRWGVRPKADSVQMNEGQEVDFEFWRLYLDGDFHCVRRVESGSGELNVSRLAGSIVKMYAFLVRFYRSSGLVGDDRVTMRWLVRGLRGRKLAAFEPRDRAELRFSPKVAAEDEAEVVETLTLDEMDRNAATILVQIISRMVLYFDYYKLSASWPEEILRQVRRYDLNQSHSPLA